MIKGSIQEEDITIVNIHAPNTGAPQCIRQTLKSGYPCLVPYLRGKSLSLSLLSLILVIGYLQIPLIKLRKFPSQTPISSL